MANVSVLNLRDNFDMTDVNLVEVDTYTSTSSTLWSWNTTGGLASWTGTYGNPHVEVRVIGTGFTYNGNDATGGTISRIELDFGGSNGSGADIVIENVPGGTLGQLNQGANDFWYPLLAGDDHFDLNSGTGNNPQNTDVVFGDYLNLHATSTPLSVTGGDDHFVNILWRHDVAGDAYSVQGSAGPTIFSPILATVNGGDDTMVAQSGGFSARLVGDVWLAGENSVVNGGNDTIDNSQNPDGGAWSSGDVFEQDGGTVNGGNDIIDTAGHNGQGLPAGDTGAGDVWTFKKGTLNGGDDFIQMHGGGNVGGDALEIRSGATGTVIGGNDTIVGSTYGDTIVGDVFDVNSIGVSITGGNDHLFGGAGNDFIYGDARANANIPGQMQLTGGDDFLSGGHGNDELHGQTGDDVLDGGAGDDFLFGGDGFDWASYASATQGVTINRITNITSGAGQDSFNSIEAFEGSRFSDTFVASNTGVNIFSGGRGEQDKAIAGASQDIFDGGYGLADIISYETSANGVVVSLAITSGQNTVGSGFDTISGFEQLFGSNHMDTLSGDDGNNSIFGLDGNDIINGGGGSDLLGGDAGEDTINGGAGNDQLIGGAGADIMDGGLGSDTYSVDNVGDVIRDHGVGRDRVESSVSFSLLGVSLEVLQLMGSGNINGTGNSLANTIAGTTGNNVLNGLAGNDSLSGGQGTDTLNGGVGDDVLNGGMGADVMDGGTGNDRYIVDNIGDVIRDHGTGRDIVESSVSFSLLGVSLEVLQLTGTGNNNGTGNSLANTISGNTGNNVLKGHAGNDRLSAGQGADQLFGDAGADILNGGYGKDRLTGGSEADRFDYNTTTESQAGSANRDAIFDFSSAEGDVIDLAGIDAIMGGADDTFTYIASSAFSSTAGQLRYDTSSGNGILQGDVNGDGIADFEIVLVGSPLIDVGDIIL